MEKFGTNYEDCAHSFAYATYYDEGENYGSRMFYKYDTIYSYGHHHIIAKKVRKKSKIAREGEIAHILFNAVSNSPTTNKQTHIVRRAINHHKIINCHSDIEYFDPIEEVKRKEQEILDITDKLSRAKADHVINHYRHSIVSEIQDIEYLIDYYKVRTKTPARIKDLVKDTTWEVLADKLEILYEKKVAAAELDAKKVAREAKKRLAKQLAREKEDIAKWRNFEIDRIHLSHSTDVLRYDKTLNEIDTSQRVMIPIKEAKTLLALFDAGKLIGAKVKEQFTVTHSNDEFIKVGCHTIAVSEIELMRKHLA